MKSDDIANRFAFHPATTEEKRDAHTSVRQQCRTLADSLNAKLPEGREKSLAITKLEEVMFWGNAALARSSTASETSTLQGFPSAVPTVSFQVDTLEELLGQLVGACSSMRFWDQLPINYPYGAGVFQEQAAKALYEAAIDAYLTLKVKAPAQLTDEERGERAYSGYFQACDGKSLISGADLPSWDEQAPEIRAAWVAAAAAVR